MNQPRAIALARHRSPPGHAQERAELHRLARREVGRAHGESLTVRAAMGRDRAR
jgi:hypothetical protein